MSHGFLSFLCGAQEQLHIKSAPRKSYSVGQRVTLQKLKMADFNGKSGKIVNFCVDEGRYEVELDGENCPIKVLPQKLKKEEIDYRKLREEEKQKHEEYMKTMMEEAKATREQLKKVNQQLAYIEQQQEDFIMSASVAGRSKPVDQIDLAETQRGLNEKLESIANKMNTSSKLSEDESDFGLDLKNTTIDTDPEDSYEESSPRSFKTNTDSQSPRSIKLHKMDKRVQEIGKTIKNSKVLVTWTFQEGKRNRDAIHHTVSLTWSKASGRVAIEMDKERIFTAKLSEGDDPFFVHKWETETGLKMQILASQKVGSTVALKNHELTVNGERFTSLPSLFY